MKISLASLGGTISMTAAPNGGITSQHSADDLLNSNPKLRSLAQWHTHTIAKIGSASIAFAHLFHTLAWAEQQLAAGADAIILSQGTDTLEQSAFFLDLYWNRPQPLILIGAMRSPDEPGFDGIANLIDAAIAAAHPDSAGRGVLIAHNRSIHEARRLQKSHSQALDAFSSGQQGPVGTVMEGQLHYHRPTLPKPRLPIPAEYSAQVLIHEHSLDDNSAPLIDWAVENNRYQGIVINAVGSGHISAALRSSLIRAAKTHPCLIASRCVQGGTTYRTYGYPGAEIDLQQHGIYMAGQLSALQARLLLLGCLWNRCSQEAMAQTLLAWRSGS